MPLDEPGWWYTSEPAPIARALRPIAALYGRAAMRRLRRGPRHHARVPVICVGNFTAGGSGKTPVAILTAKLLQRLGQRPAILTRGYGGRLAGPIWVEAAQHGARDVGDEALLLARTAPTLVSRDRTQGAAAIETHASAPSAIVMDDGLQNSELAKTLSIAVVDARRGLGNGEVIPAGPLRAPLEAQLERVDAIIVAHPAGMPVDPERGVHGWLRQRFQGPVLATRTEPDGDLAWLAGARVVAFAGIVNPHRFYDLIRGAGAEIAHEVSFKDHHAFSEADAIRLLEQARSAGAGLVTTEKDLVRLDGCGGRCGELGAARRGSRRCSPPRW